MLLTLLIALPLTLALSALISWRYRSTVRKLMRLAPSPTDSDSPGVVQSELGAIAIGPSDLEVRPSAPLPARERQLNLSLALCSVLIGTTGAWLYLLVHQQEFGGITPLRLLLVSLVWCSPGVVLQALVLRWPLSRQMPVLLGWGSALVLLLAAASVLKVARIVSDGASLGEAPLVKLKVNSSPKEVLLPAATPVTLTSSVPP